MKPARWLLLCLLVAAPLALARLGIAQEPLNSLTPKEIAEGWILPFDGQTDFGWQPRGDAKWTVQDGTLVPTPGARGLLATSTEFADFCLKVDFWIDEQANSGVFLRCPTSGPIVQGNSYEVNIYDAHAMWPTGSVNEVAKVQQPQKTVGKWNTFEIHAIGDHLRVLLNGQAAVDARDGKYARGPVALQYNGMGVVKFRNLRLRPMGLKPIFNGKDLTGWNPLPNRPAVYSVTPDGALNVRNGPGDLQSEAQFGDFVFQLDIISNGDRLNSGVFFRGDPGAFWSGYESQIRNQWMGDDRTKPVDFGTGGIYGRQPARRVIPSDREWFTKTIVAHGNHIAVYVNGIQVSDFTDTRPPSDNARQGFRAKPGVLSLQGHDPTTDLSFRNLRAVEFPVPRQ